MKDYHLHQAGSGNLQITCLCDKQSFLITAAQNFSALPSFFFLIFVVPCVMLYSGEISPTRCNNCVFIRNGFTLHVSGDNLTHHQEYNAVYGHR